MKVSAPYWTKDKKKRKMCIVIYGTPNKFIRYARYLWEQANGPVPKGKIIVHANGDQADFALSNLALTTRSEMARKMIADRPAEVCRKVRAKQVKTLMKRRMAAIYLNHKPYKFAA